MNIYPNPNKAHARALLESADLPVDDLDGIDFQHFLGCGSEDAPQGIIGYEPLGDIGLLRSLVVAPSARASGCGQALLNSLEHNAQTRGLRSLYLLTNTAEHFFARHGYHPIAREDVPDAVRQTREFSQLCPDSATVMVKTF
ncbi:MAG: arsenic resistance N-acetyltransferase ArsN2 [Pseudomonadota bacterium]